MNPSATAGFLLLILFMFRRVSLTLLFRGSSRRRVIILSHGGRIPAIRLCNCRVSDSCAIESSHAAGIAMRPDDSGAGIGV